MGRSISPTFTAIQSKNIVSSSQKPKVLFIPGLFSKPINIIFGTYFIDQLQYFKDLGYEVEQVAINTEACYCESRTELKNIIEKYDKVIFFTHSKGGVDLLDTLINFPELRQRVQKVISLQAPFYGTPLVDLISGNFFLNSIIKGLLKIFKGSYEGFLYLSVDERQKYMHENKKEISSIMKEIEFTCLGSEILAPKKKIISPLKPLYSYMKHKGLENDGIVPTISSHIVGARNYKLNGVDHACTVVKRTSIPFNRKDFTHSLLNNLVIR